MNKLMFRLQYYQKWLPYKQTDSFRKFLKNMYQLSNESLNKIDLINLYNSLYKEAKKMKSEN